MVGTFTGYTGHGFLTAYLVTVRDDVFDPIFDCAILIFERYASFIRDGRVAMTDLRRTWKSVCERLKCPVRN